MKKKLILIFLVLFFMLVSSSFADEIISSKDFINPRAMVYDKINSRLLIADSGANKIFELNLKTMKISTLAGKDIGLDEFGMPKGGYKDGSLSTALFSNPSGIAVTRKGHIIVSDTGNHAIRQIANGKVSTIAGGIGEGKADGMVKKSSFSYPTSLCVDNKNNIYVCDSGNSSVRMIDESSKVSTLKGTFTNPSGIYFDDNNLYVSDAESNTIKKIHKDGVLNLGNGEGYSNGDAQMIKFNKPTGIAVFDSIIYAADTGNHAIRKILPDADSWYASTITGGTVGVDIYNMNSYLMDSPMDVVIANQELYVADTNNARLIKLRNLNELEEKIYFEKCEIEDSVDIYINGVKVYYDDVRPIIVNDRTYIPMAIFAESVGARAEWIASERAVVIHKNGESIKLKKEEIIISQDRSFLPLRDISNKFSFNVDWDPYFRAAIVETY